MVNVSVLTLEQALSVDSPVNKLIIEASEYNEKFEAFCKGIGAEPVAALPFVDDGIQYGFSNILARTNGQLLNKSENIYADYTLNVFNTHTIDYLCGYAKTVAISPELNSDETLEIADSRCEIFVYGRQMVMVTRQCPVGIYVFDKDGEKFCKHRKNTVCILKDKKGYEFPVYTDCGQCCARVYNSMVTDRRKRLGNAEFEKRYTFITEKGDEINEILRQTV
jgi:hypothetical protein